MLKRISSLFVLLLVLSVVPTVAQLDPSFGNQGGFIFTDLAWGFRSYTYGIRAFTRPGSGVVMLARNLAENPKTGSVDSSVLLTYPGDTGSYSSRAFSTTLYPADAALQSDGKMVGIGDYQGDWFILRTNLDGSYDTSFGSTGIVMQGFGNNSDRALNVAIQSDGKIVVSGISTNSSGTITIIGRFNPDGTPDAGFGPYGNGFRDIYDGGGVLAQKMTIQPDNKIVLAGSSQQELETVTRFFRLLSDGAPDPNFGDNGLAIIYDSGGNFLTDMKSQSDGKLVTLARRNYYAPGTTNFEEQDALLTRILQNGSVDISFGTDGRVIANSSPPTIPSPLFEPSGQELPIGLVIDSSGNIVVLFSSAQVSPIRRGYGQEYQGRLGRVWVALLVRFDQTGRVSGKNFSGQLKYNEVFQYFGPLSVTGLFQQPGGKIVVYGTITRTSFSSTYFPGGYPVAMMARFSAISAVNNANNSYDYNYDGMADFATYRPGTSGFGEWMLVRSASDHYPATSYDSVTYDFGLAGDIPVPGDYDGDGIQDLAVFRDNTGDWFTRKVYLNNCAPMGCTEQVHFGLPGDVPAPGDFDGDGKTDRAVFRPSEGNWYILFSSGGWTGLHFGQTGDLPVTGDYDDDGKSDVAVIRRENGSMTWYILQSSNNQFVGIQFGLTADKAVPADYNGDGRTEVAVWRPSDGNWYRLSGYTDFSAIQWGMKGDLPAPADYDGDALTDVAVFRPSEGNYYILRSHDTTLLAYHHAGQATDIPIASVYVR